MSAVESTDADADDAEVEVEVIDEVDARALTTPMTVMDSVGMVRDADGLFEVTTASGREYIVDLAAPDDARCLCDDHRYRQRPCKHIRRCQFEIGARPIPSWVDRDDVDEQLGQHVSGEPRWSA
ncbi:hypothetical protein [Natrarchaeobius oligotrophus]|uniref:SWIM-type domain-containing protein n=1 Tax=Natrarchaeobius chitinivorans TaxID=1679083 RepID=A0A3N6M0C0_NATCH|nr:hypothetical protein [Natrarchaeobius chitinivorans]RQG93704.1 hypothetical protein EA472_22470 [Natrarchaeobius chitinivorans]